MENFSSVEQKAGLKTKTQPQAIKDRFGKFTNDKPLPYIPPVLKKETKKIEKEYSQDSEWMSNGKGDKNDRTKEIDLQSIDTGKL